MRICCGVALAAAVAAVSVTSSSQATTTSAFVLGPASLPGVSRNGHQLRLKRPRAMATQDETRDLKSEDTSPAASQTKHPRRARANDGKPNLPPPNLMVSWWEGTLVNGGVGNEERPRKSRAADLVASSNPNPP